MSSTKSLITDIHVNILLVLASAPYGNPHVSRTTARRETTHTHLEREWQLTWALLIGIGGADAAILRLPTIGFVHPVTLRCVMFSATFAAVGFAVIIYLQATYRGASTQTSRVTATTIYLNCLTRVVPRLPFGLALASLASLSLFLLSVAHSLAPRVVFTIATIVALLVGLEYIHRAYQVLTESPKSSLSVYIDTALCFDFMHNLDTYITNFEH
ncbi:hypothetical protein PENSPDRAFT_357029 [Peniophora sp. CONT]|nr:hypothetical protein PENSPDRAFT_357029 [Peniophora sp. CONT]